jgi:hypothetical protein
MTCVDRPMVGGRVVPFVSVVLASGRPVLGSVHNERAMRCIMQRLCQICGQPLEHRVVVFVSQESLDAEYSSEAGLHPQCAGYSERACPVLNGSADTYRSVDGHLGSDCSEPGCTCEGWVGTDPGAVSLRGKPIGPWWAVWLDNYAIAVNADGKVHGLTWRGQTPIKVRPLAATRDRPTS